MDAKEIRVKNLNRLLDDSGLDRSAFAQKLGYSDVGYFNQIIKGIGSFGPRTARKIEKALGLAHGYMDQIHDDNAISSGFAKVLEPLRFSFAAKVTLDQCAALYSGQLSRDSLDKVDLPGAVPDGDYLAVKIEGSANGYDLPDGFWVAVDLSKKPKIGDFGLFVHGDQAVLAKSTPAGPEFTAYRSVVEGKVEPMGKAVVVLPKFF